jgi:serine/threonine protein phosphatase PrpC
MFLTVARTHVGCRRKVNEDAILARPDLGIWAVADGMGGHDAGDVASALIVDALAGACSDDGLEARTGDVQGRLLATNARLRAMAQSGPEPRTIGSTVAALLVDGGRFACLWAGDSRIYLARRHALTQLTRDHSLVQELVDLGEIDPADARTHPNANIITRAVGAEENLEIDVVTQDVLAGDAFLLASDGLTRLAEEDELLEALQSEQPEGAADRLLELCLGRGAPDNVSFVLVRVSSD